MHRTTITLDEELAIEIDAYIDATSALSRSEAIRDLVRRGLSTRPAGPAEAPCFGVISCAINQSVRKLAARVPQSRLDRHDQTVAALSVPIDHSTSIDVVVMRGCVADVSAYAEALFLERGILHGMLALIPVGEDTTVHAHDDGPSGEHTHLRVQSSF